MNPESGLSLAVARRVVVLGGDSRRSQVESFVLEPLFWLALFGLPLAVLVGFLLGYTLAQRARETRLTH